MAIKVTGNVLRLDFDGTTISIPMSIRATGQGDDVVHTFSGLAANIANAAAMGPYLKGQIVSYVLSQYGLSTVDTEIAIAGLPL